MPFTCIGSWEIKPLAHPQLAELLDKVNNLDPGWVVLSHFEYYGFLGHKTRIHYSLYRRCAGIEYACIPLLHGQLNSLSTCQVERLLAYLSGVLDVLQSSRRAPCKA